MHWWEKLVDWGWQAFFALVGAAISAVLYVHRWMRASERQHDEFKLHVAEHYVKKSDLNTLKADIAAEFKEVKDGQSQILDVLLNQKIGRRR